MKRLYAKKQSGGTFTMVGGVDTQAQDLTIKDVYLPIQTPQKQQFSPYGSGGKGKATELKGHSNTVNQWQSDMMSITNALNSMEEWELMSDKGKRFISMYTQLTSPAYVNAVERELKNTEAAEARIKEKDRASDIFYTSHGFVAVKTNGKIQLIDPSKINPIQQRPLTAGEIINELDVNPYLSQIGSKELLQQAASSFIGTEDITQMLKDTVAGTGISSTEVKETLNTVIQPGSPLDIGKLTNLFINGYVGNVQTGRKDKSNINQLETALFNLTRRLNPQQNTFIDTMGKLKLKELEQPINKDTMEAYRKAYLTSFIMKGLTTEKVRESSITADSGLTRIGFGAGKEEPKERLSYATLALNSLTDTFEVQLKDQRPVSFYGSSISTAKPTETKEGRSIYHTAATQNLVSATALTPNAKIFLGDVELNRNDLSKILLLENAAYMLIPTRNGKPAIDIISKHQNGIEQIKVKYTSNPNDPKAEQELKEYLTKQKENIAGIEMKMQLVVPKVAVFNDDAEKISSNYFTPKTFDKSENPSLYESLGIRGINTNNLFADTKLEAPLIITNVPLSELNRISSSYENIPIKTEGVSDFIIGQTATPSIPATTTPSYSTFDALK